jgi:hypothetical protein
MFRDYQPPEAKFQLHFRIIPIPAVIVERVLPPRAFRLARTYLGQIFRAAPRPIRPAIYISVSHRIMMNIIQCRPVMSIRTHRALDSTEENFSPASLLFSVPSVRSAAVKPPQIDRPKV